MVETLDLGEDAEGAARTYSLYEERYRDRTDLEIVLVGADSLETVRTTHAQYFESEAEDPLLDVFSKESLR